MLLFPLFNQKIEEELKVIFPELKVLRMDKDTTSKFLPLWYVRDISQFSHWNTYPQLLHDTKLAYPLRFKNNITWLDKDTTSKKGSLEEILNKFKNKEADILIGTQMLSKGLDFDNVTLVGIINI